MQIVTHKGKIVEKVLRDREGRLIRAKFYVYEVGGRIRARLLEATVINELVGQVLSLFAPKNAISSKGTFPSKSFTSPYFTKDTLNFLGNKPRAPTF